MPYCVHCGVELEPAAKACPLCHTPVIDPNQLQLPASSPFFPTRKPEIKPVSRLELAILVSVMFLSAGGACALLNLFLRPDVAWSLYIVAALVTLWIWFVPPLILPRIPGYVQLPLDVFAVGLYIFLVSLGIDGIDWFFDLAFPIILCAGVIAFVLSYLLRDHRVSVLSSITIDLVAIGLFFMCVEYFGDCYFFGEWQPGWALILFTICIALVIPLVVIRRVPSLREEARRRFHL